MGDLTAKEILLAILGSGGIIGGLFVAFNFIAARVDRYRERKEARRKLDLSEATEFRKAELEAQTKGQNDLVTNLWKMIETERAENEELRQEINELEKAEKLSRPTVVRVYRIIREMRAELDALQIMVLSEKETRVFAKRWNAVKELTNRLEIVIAGDEGSPSYQTPQDPETSET